MNIKKVYIYAPFEGGSSANHPPYSKDEQKRLSIMDIRHSSRKEA